MQRAVPWCSNESCIVKQAWLHSTCIQRVNCIIQHMLLLYKFKFMSRFSAPVADVTKDLSNVQNLLSKFCTVLHPMNTILTFVMNNIKNVRHGVLIVHLKTEHQVSSRV